MKTHKDLNVWIKSIDFVTCLYQLTSKFPSHELYGMVSQIRRASVSILANIAEGAARNHRKEYVQFIGYSIGSASEIEILLIVSRNLQYLDDETYKKTNLELEIIMKMLTNLQRGLSKGND